MMRSTAHGGPVGLTREGRHIQGHVTTCYCCLRRSQPGFHLKGRAKQHGTPCSGPSSVQQLARRRQRRVPTCQAWFKLPSLVQRANSEEQAAANEELYRSLQSPDPYIGPIKVADAGGAWQQPGSCSQRAAVRSPDTPQIAGTNGRDCAPPAAGPMSLFRSIT
jgi:hypothetical protein